MMNDSIRPQNPRKPSASYAFLILCAAFMITGVLVLAYLGTKPPAKMHGKLMPTITLDALANVEKSFSTNDLLDKKSAILLWSPTNQNCQDHVENLKAFLSDHSDWQLVTIAFAEQGGFDLESIQKDVDQFLTKNKLNWPVFVDSTGKATMELTLLMPFGSFGFPTLLLVDRESRVIQVVESQNSEGWKNLNAALK